MRNFLLENSEDGTMTEINPNLNHIPQIKATPETTGTPATQEEAAEAKLQMNEYSLSKMPQAALGQSQVRFEGNLNDDVEKFCENPALCSAAMEVGDIAQKLYEKDGDEQAPLKALNVAKAFSDEFAK